MRVLVIGANGKTGRIIVDLLRDGVHEPVAMIRKGEQAGRFSKLGIRTAIADLEEPLDPVLDGCDAVIFAAGSGSSTGPEKTLAVDRDGAIRTIAAMEEVGVSRFVMLSSMRADPESTGNPISFYLRAKGIADQHLQRSELDWTIVRPGRLTDDEGTGTVRIAPHLEEFGSIPRADVANVLVAALDHRGASSRAFDVLEGESPISDALDAI